jgi:hypothetical protein
MTILNIYNSYYKHIPLDVFNAAVSADPTSYNQGKIVKVGNFVKWILKLYSNNAWKLGDIFETKDLLSKFIKYKSKLPLEKKDINRYNSVSELYSLIRTLEGQGVKTQSEVKREGAEVVYEDGEWKIVIPHTEEASCIYGAHTKWCTAGREHNMFNYYNKRGPLYININKVTGDKYQFHFESGSFMDAEDEEISPKEIGLSDGALEYYKSIGKEPYFIYDYIGEFSNGFAAVELEGKGWNFINTNGELLWKEDKWFDFVGDFYNGPARVKLEGKGWNLIKPNGELVWKEDEWFDYVWIFYNGFAWGEIKGQGWNFINTQGELVWKGEEWFDNVDNFYNGFARVKIEGKYNFINPQGELLWKEEGWFDDAYYFFEGFAIVELEGRGYNFINTQGELVWKGDKWFDDVYNFREGFARVYREGKGWNYINGQGELLYKGDIWFDFVEYFSEGIARVIYNGTEYMLNTKGELVN